MNNSNLALADLGWSTHFSMQVDSDELNNLTPARLTQIHRSQIEAITTDGAKTLTTGAQDSTGEFAVGDWVLVNELNQIDRRLERLTLLERRIAGGEAKNQLIGANIDVVFITTSCNRDFNVARLERYLILARSAGIQPVILLTKADLDDEPAAYESKVQKLDPMLPVISLDARDQSQVGAMLDWWRPGQTAALLGSSGVGKTTLLNSLTETKELTAGMREDDAKGRHTTTSRGLYPATDGRWLIDTPGMRELRLLDVAEGVEAVFSDILELAAQCRFTDCQHETEPKCAVQTAIATGDLDPDRLKRWRKLEREEKNNSMNIAEARKRNKENAKYVKATLAKAKELKGLPDSKGT